MVNGGNLPRQWAANGGKSGEELEGKPVAVSLAGPGVKATIGWEVPQLVLREASKQRGSLLIVPEQGMRLQVATRDGVTQLDPQKSGVRQKGVLAFRILQTPWSLALDIEQVEFRAGTSDLPDAGIAGGPAVGLGGCVHDQPSPARRAAFTLTSSRSAA